MNKDTRQKKGPGRASGRSAALRRDKQVTRSARARRPDVAREEAASTELRQAIIAAFEQA